MSAPIYDRVGNLDVLVYVILNSLGLNPIPLSATNRTLDQITEANAYRFVTYFAEAPIHGIKELRETFGLPLVDARDAWWQIVDTYVGREGLYRESAISAINNGNYVNARYYVESAERYRGV